jgi:hypothetical protein
VKPSTIRFGRLGEPLARVGTINDSYGLHRHNPSLSRRTNNPSQRPA